MQEELTPSEKPVNGFFVPLENDRPFFKAALEGFAGSGKSYTMALIAAGLHSHIGSEKPIAIFDTERASKFLKPFFKDRGITAVVKNSRSLADLSKAIQLCEAGAADILLIDSISHPWEDFLQAYLSRVNRKRLEIQDWGIIKPTWKREFSDRFVTSQVHILMTGRAGYEYDREVSVDEHTGKKRTEFVKSGIKMKVDGETAYEPDLLVLMERFEEVLGDDKKVWREGTVLKDRAALIDGKTFKNPTFDNFQPMIHALLSDPVPPKNGESQGAGSLFDVSDHEARRRTEREILVEQIEAELTRAAPGQTAKEKKWRLDAMANHFGLASWTFIKARCPLEKLEAGLSDLKSEIAAAMAAAEAETQEDVI